MTVPSYNAPATIDEALRLKSELGADARVIAGGTDLILKMRDHLYSPSLLIDLQNLALDAISGKADGVRIGPSTTHSQLLASADINAIFPALAQACREFAGPPIRNRGTIGGNIVNASPAADLIPPLLAYDASVVLASSAGIREVELAEFFTGPGQTIMAANEILTEIRLPNPSSPGAATFIKLGQRRSMAIALVSIATRLSLDKNGLLSEARIVLGSVAPTPVRALDAEALLVGSKPTEELIDSAAIVAGKTATPITDVRASEGYRNDMTEVLVRRALRANLSDLNDEHVQ
jgi:CO/xanthine dehydrogenase FAD-binding subunit